MTTKTTVPIVIGSSAGNFPREELMELGIPEDCFVVTSKAAEFVSQLGHEQQLVIIDTGRQFGIANQDIAEGWIRESNPKATIIHIDGWADCRQHFPRIKEFLARL